MSSDALVKAFTDATEDDLEHVRATIADFERDLTTLRGLEQVLAGRFGVKAASLGQPAGNGTPTATAAAKPSSSGAVQAMTEKRRKVVAYLRTTGMGKAVQAISEGTGIARQGPNALSAVLAHEWFHTNPDGIVTLTDRAMKDNPDLKRV